MYKQKRHIPFQARAILILSEESKELEEMARTHSVAYTNRKYWIRILPQSSKVETLRILTEAKRDLVV